VILFFNNLPAVALLLLSALVAARYTTICGIPISYDPSFYKKCHSLPDTSRQRMWDVFAAASINTADINTQTDCNVYVTACSNDVLAGIRGQEVIIGTEPNHCSVWMVSKDRDGMVWLVHHRTTGEYARVKAVDGQGPPSDCPPTQLSMPTHSRSIWW